MQVISRDEILEVKQILEESVSTYKETLESDYESFYKQHMDYNTYLQIISLDPTYKQGSDIKGNYGKWLMSIAGTNPERVLEDSEKIKKALVIYNELKARKQLDANGNRVYVLDARSKDIMNFKSADELRSFLDAKGYLNPVSNDNGNDKAAETVSDLAVGLSKNEYELLYSDNEWELYIPKTFNASCKLGANTEWCTASGSDHSKSYFTDYSTDGPLLILINKKENKKWQIHFESNQWKDERDVEVSKPSFIREHVLPEGLTNVLWKYGKDKNFGRMFDPAISQEERMIYALENLKILKRYEDGSYDLEGDIIL